MTIVQNQDLSTHLYMHILSEYVYICLIKCVYSLLFIYERSLFYKDDIENNWVLQEGAQNTASHICF